MNFPISKQPYRKSQYLDNGVASVLLYSSRRQNKNSELSYETKLGSYEAELSCLSKSSISLPREKKKSAIFGSQQTTTLDRSLVYNTPRIGEVKTSIDNTTGQHSLFLDSSIFFFNSTRIFFFDSNFKISTRVFFLFVNIYFANVNSYFLLYSMYFTSFDLSIMFSTCFYYRYNFVRNGTP